MKRYAEATKFLLDRGADVNSLVGDWSPIFFACAYGHKQVLSVLLDHPNVRTEVKDQEGNTPLSICQQANRLEMVEMIRKKIGETEETKKEPKELKVDYNGLVENLFEFMREELKYYKGLVELQQKKMEEKDKVIEGLHSKIYNMTIQSQQSKISEQEEIISSLNQEIVKLKPSQLN